MRKLVIENINEKISDWMNMLNTFAFSEWKNVSWNYRKTWNTKQNKHVVKQRLSGKGREERSSGRRGVLDPLIVLWFLSYLVMLKVGLSMSHLAELGKGRLSCKYVRKWANKIKIKSSPLPHEAWFYCVVLERKSKGVLLKFMHLFKVYSFIQ